MTTFVIFISIAYITSKEVKIDVLYHQTSSPIICVYQINMTRQECTIFTIVSNISSSPTILICLLKIRLHKFFISEKIIHHPVWADFYSPSQVSSIIWILMHEFDCVSFSFTLFMHSLSIANTQLSLWLWHQIRRRLPIHSHEWWQQTYTRPRFQPSWKTKTASIGR